MKKIVCALFLLFFLSLLVMICCDFSSEEYFSEETAIDKARIILKEKYPSITAAQLANIDVGKTQRTHYYGKSCRWTVFFWYHNKEYLQTYVSVDGKTGEFEDSDPWDFETLVNFYDSILPEEHILEIAKQEYDKRMQEAKKINPGLLDFQKFIAEYGEAALGTAEDMIIEITLNPQANHPGLTPDYQPKWRVEFKHPLQVELNGMENTRSTWCEMEFDVYGNLESARDNFFRIQDESMWDEIIY